MYEGALASVPRRRAGEHHPVRPGRRRPRHPAARGPPSAARTFAESHAVARELGAEGNPRAAVGEGLLARERGDLALPASTCSGHSRCWPG